MNVLMFGWEFPPHNSGGLGVACEGLVRGLSQAGARVTFVLPKTLDCKSDYGKIIFADALRSGSHAKASVSAISGYISSTQYAAFVEKYGLRHFYAADLFGEVMHYAQEAEHIALSEEFDIIHCHDWLACPAGLMAKRVSGKPLVVHVHATELDRTGGNNVDERVYNIEKEIFEQADVIIAVSNFTKNKIVRHYGIHPKKIRVVYNAIDYDDIPPFVQGIGGLKRLGKKIVLFVGRITLQKGPDYFIRAAKRVLEKNPDVIFIVAGSGDMERQIIEEAASLNIADKVLFAGFLRGDELIALYRTADLFVLSSVSEPFGIAPLEALSHGVPVLISKQSGLSEVLVNSLKVDFWDINEMANKILAVLTHKELHETLKEHGQAEVKKMNWQDQAKKCIGIYQEVLRA